MTSSAHALTVCLRFEVDLSRLPPNERQLYTHVLDPGKGRLVFLVTLVLCWGVSISEIETATMTNPEEKEVVINKYVCHFHPLIRLNQSV